MLKHQTLGLHADLPPLAFTFWRGLNRPKESRLSRFRFRALSPRTSNDILPIAAAHLPSIPATNRDKLPTPLRCNRPIAAGAAR